MAHRVSKAVFAELVERAIDELPDQFAAALEEVPIEIRDRATPAERKKAGIKGNDLLLGLYHGVALTHRTAETPDWSPLPAVIYIFQYDIEQVSDSEAELIEQVRTTVLHEIGHHFGLDEDDLEDLGYR